METVTAITMAAAYVIAEPVTSLRNWLLNTVSSPWKLRTIPSMAETSKAYEPKQFHVSRNGLALLVAYVLHLLDNSHATTPN